MKKLLLSSFFLSAIGFSTSAQISVGQWDVALPGNVLLQAHDTLKPMTPGSINPGSAGANQVWSFSTLGAHVVDTLTTTNPNWLPNGSTFPNANLAIMNSSDGSEIYLNNNASGLYIEGFYGDPFGIGAMAISYDSVEQLAKFTDTFNTTFQNTAYAEFEFSFTQIPGVDSLQVRHYVNKNIATDGWGTITTPLGSNISCLRHSGLVVTIDSIFAHPIGPPGWIHLGAPYSPNVDSSWHFSWWGSGKGFAILEFDSTAGDTIRNINFLKAMPSPGGIQEAAVAGTMSVYPNPAVDIITFEFKSNEINSVDVFDLFGNKIAALPVNKTNKIVFNAQQLSAGTYLYRSADANGKMMGKGLFEVIK